ncbi:MAG: DNA polymerase I [Candidatus Saccharimonadales bacterium]|nr:DNA polymerase I [Candidatus Saccharimonadales bacterium]
MAKKRLVVIDGKSVFYRGYYAMPNLSLKDGTPMGGVYGFAVMALEVVKKMQPDYVAVAWDKAKTSTRRRVKIYPEYKANRKPAPPDFYEQIPYLHELIEAFGWPFFEVDDHEADDIMGTLATQAKKKDVETVLISSDHDLLQLVNDSTTVAILRKGLTNVEMFNPKHFTDKYQMTTDQFIDYKSLRGDPSDNIPGVAGVGEKTATQLIMEHGSLDGVYDDIELIRGSLYDKLKKDKKMAYTTKKLVVLDTKVPVKLDLRKANIKNLDVLELNKKLRQYEFRTLLRQLPEHMKVDEDQLVESTVAGSGTFKPAKQKVIIKTANELKELDLKSARELVLHVRTTDAFQRHSTHVIISDKPDSAVVIELSPELHLGMVAEHFKTVLASGKVPKIGYDIKNSIKAFLNFDIEPSPVGHDVRIAAFMINSLIREQSLTKLAQDALGYEGSDLDNVPPEEFTSKAGAITGAVWGLYKDQTRELKKIKPLHKLAVETEFPVVSVLARMEHAGIQIDVDYLNKFKQELDDEISDLEQTAYGFSGNEFNLNSPVQVSEVLYDRLKLPTTGVKKNKSGFYSTDSDSLQLLKGKHPIIDTMLKHREYAKLRGTYADALPKLVDEENALHTTFSLSTAATGRLSSNEPNLQHIPVRTDLGKRIRQAFIARGGNVFVSADYSQFELRLAAVLAGDDDLIESFNDGLDIHTRTAAQVYGVAMEDVTKAQRRDAKVINFGILYGMSPHGLSVATGMKVKEAKEFIDRYFELRKPILDYMEATKKKARNEGYVETLFGRRRPTPDVKSSNFVVRQAAERAAINMPIQGTEADLMKMAMIAVDDKLDADSKQLLQIHDSILVECPEWKASKVSKMLKTTMEGIYKLKVNLDVDVSTGRTWGEL